MIQPAWNATAPHRRQLWLNLQNHRGSDATMLYADPESEPEPVADSADDTDI